ncbi:rab-GTPase-TBC domain-containing protein [Ditylenchus destructor]|nr:rab-GTPase-TBC domain-containing protein [Ditylenchus destructor]
MQQRNNWTQNAPMPGSVRPVYGAQYPPLQKSTDNGAAGGSPTKTDMKFKNYENSVSDVWDAGVSVDDDLVLTSAAKVLELHASAINNTNLAASRTNEDQIMPNCQPVPSKNNKVQAMQRLATQREPIPGVVTAVTPAAGIVTTTSGTMYPRLPEVSLGGNRPNVPYNASNSTANSTTSLSVTTSNPSVTSIMPKSPQGWKNDGDMSRFARLRRMLGIRPNSNVYPTSNSSDGNDAGNNSSVETAETVVNMDELRKDCWLGIPHKIRPLAWRILSGYIPPNLDRREATLKRKREEYWHYVEQYFHTRYDEQHQITFRQIHIDIPRMCPLIPLFQQKLVQEIFERVLYIWAIRHPASGYVQGINDLVTPFFVVFLSEYIHDVGTFDVAQLERKCMEVVEADSFWCVSALLDTIQDNYTFAQPGIQRKVHNLQELMKRVDKKLYEHFEAHGVEFLQFAFRWMNNLLMREIPLRATIRFERNGFSQFHTYVCGAFLRLWSRQLQSEKDFQGVMLLLQNLPTQSWNDQQICELTADAYSLMQVFHGAKIG